MRINLKPLIVIIGICIVSTAVSACSGTDSPIGTSTSINSPTQIPTATPIKSPTQTSTATPIQSPTQTPKATPIQSQTRLALR